MRCHAGCRARFSPLVAGFLRGLPGEISKPGWGKKHKLNLIIVYVYDEHIIIIIIIIIIIDNDIIFVVIITISKFQAWAASAQRSVARPLAATNGALETRSKQHGVEQ